MKTIKNFFSAHWKVLLAAFVGGVLLPLAFPEALKTEVANNYNEVSLEQAIVNYHLTADVITNDFLERLFDEENPVIEFPPTDEQCEYNNVSTFCLAVALDEELGLLESSIINRKDEIDLNIEGTPTLDEAFDQISIRQNTIDEAIEVARDTLDLNLAVYNQVQIVYPVHTELTALLRNLEDYQENLGDIRSILELYPSKFNDASTVQCK